MTDRTPRCRKLDKRRNPCPNPEVTELGLCLTHLQEAHAEYEALLSTIRATPESETAQ
jgi:hypothetical protein